MMNFERRCKMLTINEAKLELRDLLEGCGKDIDNGGSCWFYRLNGRKAVYCSSCSRKIKILENRIRGL